MDYEPIYDEWYGFHMYEWLYMMLDIFDEKAWLIW